MTTRIDIYKKEVNKEKYDLKVSMPIERIGVIPRIGERIIELESMINGVVIYITHIVDTKHDTQKINIIYEERED